ncbi:MAG: right-handed parallel beta-helix repeat-containing protein [Bacteroidales bacterium]|nr:right-handed parallel beta-helix repeat-containing protein [Bacteroidales bacterium]
MNTKHLFRLLAVTSFMALLSCSKVEETQVLDENPGVVENPSAEKVYSFSIRASKSAAEPGSRALSLDGKVLNALWVEGEEVTAYNETKGAALEGSLVAQTSGGSTTLKGNLTGTVAPGDALTLKFLSPSYETQDGTLTGGATSIDKVCDYATASVTVDGVDADNNVTIKGEASFTNHQAIVKFTLFQEDGTTVVPANPLKVMVGDVTYTVTPASPTNELFVAVPAVAGNKIILIAITDDDEFTFVNNSATFESGKYYAITVKMTDWTIVFNETELNDAVAAGKTKIRLGCDIPLQNYFLVADSKNIKLDLNGNTLSRSLTAADVNGHVIEIYSGATLTVIDSGGSNTRSGDGGGKLSGGWANNGGGICNYGTLKFEGGTITGCKATNGGGIFNGGILTVGQASITGCQATNGGGIYLKNGSQSALSGATISDNTASDAGGIYVENTSETSLADCVVTGNKSADHGGGGIVNYGTVSLNGSTITGNTCHTNGGGIWDNGTLNVQGAVTVKDNSGDDIYVKSGKVISLSGALTGGEGSIGINMQNAGTFTNRYSVSGTGTNPFFSNHPVNRVTEGGGECKMSYGYYECSWDDASGKVTRTAKVIPAATAVDNLCSSKYSSGGDLWGNSYWFVVDGTATIPNGIQARNDVNLILCDGAQLTLNKGLVVNSGATLRIFSQSFGDNMGKLTSLNSEVDCAGIGGSVGNNTGTIIIHGGIIAAKGGKGGGAGIGGADYKASGDITIFDGSIHAISCDTYDENASGAAIGGGQDGRVTSITIYGGSITADGQGSAAGIGSGARASQGGTITIKGGSINATGGNRHEMRGGGAGIGTGGDGAYNAMGAVGGSITISGGTIVAHGGDGDGYWGYSPGGGAGIGTGGRTAGWADGAVITITGGNIDTQGGINEGDTDDDGAGIGGGHLCPGGNVVISGGVIKAKAGAQKAAAIGAGDECQEQQGSLTLNHMKVSLGSGNTYTPVISIMRTTYCREISVLVEPCDHSSVNNNVCDWCSYMIP